MSKAYDINENTAEGANEHRAIAHRAQRTTPSPCMTLEALVEAIVAGCQ